MFNEIRYQWLRMTWVANLANKGAKVIMLAEEIVYVAPEVDSHSLKILKDAAIKNNIFIIGSYASLTDSTIKNKAMIISLKGEILSDCSKVHLFELEASRGMIAGNKIGLFQLDTIPSGIAICKDLDYPDYIRSYDSGKPNVLFVPAFDFGKDGWLHSRMAIFRGIENGFSIVRTARNGKLTTSNYAGKVLNEESSISGKTVSLVGQGPLSFKPTLFGRWSDWFANIILIAAVILLYIALLGFSKEKLQTKVERQNEIQ